MAKTQPEDGGKILAQVRGEEFWGSSSQRDTFHSRSRNSETCYSGRTEKQRRKVKDTKNKKVTVPSMCQRRCVGGCREKSFCALFSICMTSKYKNCSTWSQDKEMARCPSEAQAGWEMMTQDSHNCVPSKRHGKNSRWSLFSDNIIAYWENLKLTWKTLTVPSKTSMLCTQWKGAWPLGSWLSHLVSTWTWTRYLTSLITSLLPVKQK